MEHDHAQEARTMKMRYITPSTLLVAALLSLSAGCASTRHHESTGQYIDDSVITSKVKSSLVNDSGLSAFDINVETYEGVVQLSGFVDTKQDMDQAITVAKGVEGVKSVKNDMHLKSQ
jgi:osmotically-inducible protein OsmY